MAEPDHDESVLGKRGRNGTDDKHDADEAVVNAAVQEEDDDDDDVGPMPMPVDAVGGAKKKRKGAFTSTLCGCRASRDTDIFS